MTRMVQNAVAGTFDATAQQAIEALAAPDAILGD